MAVQTAELVINYSLALSIIHTQAINANVLIC